MKRAGHCLCGQVSVVIDDEAKELEICHCKNCQLQSGSAYAPFLAVASSKLTILGMPKCFNDQDTVSGRVVRRHFCGDCGSPVYVTVERAPILPMCFQGCLIKPMTSDQRFTVGRPRSTHGLIFRRVVSSIKWMPAYLPVSISGSRSYYSPSPLTMRWLQGDG